jgi:hypothetical protein
VPVVLPVLPVSPAVPVARSSDVGVGVGLLAALPPQPPSTSVPAATAIATMMGVRFMSCSSFGLRSCGVVAFRRAGKMEVGPAAAQ